MSTNYDCIKSLLPEAVFNMGIDFEKKGGQKRFASVTEESLQDLLRTKNAPKTDDSTTFALNVAIKYCEETEGAIPDDPEELNAYLCKFYAAVRTKKGQYYKLNSMNSIRFGLQRYFKEKNKIDIIDDNRFMEANITFKNMLIKIKKAGKGDTNHYPEIEPEDLIKLFEGFDIEDPTGLQNIVWFYIMYFLIRRGRENMREMTKDSFRVAQDATGKHFIFQTVGESDKNHTIYDAPTATTGEGRIYATDGPKCPVKCFQKYLSLLNPNLNALWQRPRAKMSICHKIWYCNVPLGEKYLGNMLPMMCTQYKLNERYTNHCLRVTSLQLLDDCNVDSRHIIRVSGHKNTDSITNYARRLSNSRKRKISSLLASSVCADGQEKDATLSTTESSTVPCSSSSRSNNILIECNKNNNKTIDEVDDSILSNLPETIFNCPARVFAPVIKNCSNITFNVYYNNNDGKK